MHSSTVLDELTSLRLSEVLSSSRWPTTMDQYNHCIKVTPTHLRLSATPCGCITGAS